MKSYIPSFDYQWDVPFIKPVSLVTAPHTARHLEHMLDETPHLLCGRYLVGMRVRESHTFLPRWKPATRVAIKVQATQRPRGYSAYVEPIMGGYTEIASGVSTLVGIGIVTLINEHNTNAGDGKGIPVEYARQTFTCALGLRDAHQVFMQRLEPL